jgi:Flp pilus assembly protein TadB
MNLIGGIDMSDEKSAAEDGAKKKDNTLGIGWYFAIFFLVVLLMVVASMLLGSLMPALGAEAFILIAVCLLAGVIVCCTVYFAGVLNRSEKD